VTATVTDHIQGDKPTSLVVQTKQELTIGKSIVSRGLQELSEFLRRDSVRSVQDQSLDPKDAAAFSSRGDAYYDKGEFDRAIQDYDQVIRLNPTSAAAFNNRGLAYVATGQFDQAIQDYDPEPDLDKIRAKVLLINDAEDHANPPELGTVERAMKRVRHGRYVLIPAGPDTHGHFSHFYAALWKPYLIEFMATLSA